MVNITTFIILFTTTTNTGTCLPVSGQRRPEV